MKNILAEQKARDFVSKILGSRCFLNALSKTQRRELQEDVSSGFPLTEEDILIAVTDINFSKRGFVLVNDQGTFWFITMRLAPKGEAGKRWGPFLPPPWQEIN